MSSIDSLRADVSDGHKIVVGPFKGHAKSGVNSIRKNYERGKKKQVYSSLPHGLHGSHDAAAVDRFLG